MPSFYPRHMEATSTGQAKVMCTVDPELRRRAGSTLPDPAWHYSIHTASTPQKLRA